MTFAEEDATRHHRRRLSTPILDEPTWTLTNYYYALFWRLSFLLLGGGGYTRTYTNYSSRKVLRNSVDSVEIAVDNSVSKIVNVVPTTLAVNGRRFLPG